jgi:hypothetical protein
MANKVVLKRSAVQGKTPTTGDLALGELALNTYDGNLFFKRDVSSTESIVRVATNTNLLSYTRVTANTTAVSRQAYIADTSGGTFTITLPSSPATGDWVTIVDGASFQTTALTVARNSSTIADITENLSLNIEGVSVTFVYDGSTWEVYTQVGANGGDGTFTASSTTTLTNKTISGSSNTLSNIANASLTNSSVTVNGTSISLGSSETVTAAAGTLTGNTLASGVTASSLTSVGTIATGVWNGTAITGQYGGTGVNNSGKTITLGGNLTTSGAHTTTLTTTANTSVTLPTSGTLGIDGPAFSAYAAAVLQTITSGSQQKVLFQTEEFDTNNNYANSRFTPTVAGYYQLNAEVRIDGTSGTGEMMIVIWKNGAEYKRGVNQQGTQIAANFWAMQVSSLVYANGSTDYFEIYVQQGSGADRTVTAVNSPNITWFNGCMVRGA